jgi:hypothetical protein
MSSGKYKTWEKLPEELKRRWAPMKALVEGCFAKGLTLHILDEGVNDVTEAGYPFGGPAIYWRMKKIYVVAKAIIERTDPSLGEYFADVHEMGHAVRFLLISPHILLTKIAPLYHEAKRNKAFLDYYAESNLEEFFAQAFEAFWTKPSLGEHPIPELRIDWSREELRGKHKALHDYMYEQLKTLGGQVEEYIS